MRKNKSDKDKPCRVLLRSVSNNIDSIGFANVQLQPAKFMIIGIDLPDPQVFGPNCTRYMGWILDNQSENKFGIELNMTYSGVWIGEGSNDLLVEFDEVIITPETEISPNCPTGPRILVGILSSCFIS